MNRIIIDPFTVNLPKKDIHGETEATCVAVINSFIKDCIAMKKYKCIIIHGKGKGILKRKTKELLSHDNRVDKFYIDGMNDGQTIVEIKKIKVHF